MNKSIEEILSPKPQVRPLIYAYSIDDKAHAGLLKIGQTTREVKTRVAEQLRTAAIENYRIEIERLQCVMTAPVSVTLMRTRPVQKKFRTLNWRDKMFSI